MSTLSAAIKRALHQFGPQVTIDQLQTHTGIDHGDLLDGLSTLRARGEVMIQKIRGRPATYTVARHGRPARAQTILTGRTPPTTVEPPA